MAEPVCVLLFGMVGADHVSLSLGPLMGNADDPYAARPADVTVRAGPFSGAFRTMLRPAELRAFLIPLRAIHDTLAGTALLEALEGTVQLRITGNGSGHMTVAGTFADGIHHDCRLHFAFDIDQTFLPPVIDAASALEEFRAG